MSKLWFSLLLPVFLLALPLPVLAGAEKLQEMSEMFDRLDREDLLDGLERADACTAKRDFSCADSELRKAKKLVNGSGDQRLWAQAKTNRLAEQQRVQDEQEQQQALVRQRQIAAQQEQARQRALQQQRQAAQASSDDFQWGKAAALLGGAAIGGLSELPSETQVQLVTDILQDSAGGQEGISNTQNSIDSMSSTGGSGTSSAGNSAGSGPGEDEISRAGQACEAQARQNGQPFDEPQIDTLCMLATFNQCLKQRLNDSSNDAQTQATCNNLRATVDALGVQNRCNACR